MVNFDQIYRPEWATGYSYVIEIPSIITIIIYPFVLYTVLAKAPISMRIYRWMLANSITWSFSLELIYFVSKPYFLYRFTLAPIGITKNFGSTAGYIQLELIVFFFCLNCASLSLCAFYRYSKAVPDNEGFWFSKNWHIVATMIWGFVFLVFPPIFALVMSRVPVELLKEKLKNEVFGVNPKFFDTLFISIIGYDPNLNAWFYAMVGCTIFSLFVLSSLALVTLISLYRILKTNQYRWSTATLKMQWMLFNTFSLSILAALIFLVTPYASVIMIVLTVQAYASPIICLMIICQSFHCLIDYAILMYNIRPYRRFCKKCVTKLLSMFWWCKKQSQIQVTLVEPTTYTGTSRNL